MLRNPRSIAYLFFLMPLFMVLSGCPDDNNNTAPVARDDTATTMVNTPSTPIAVLANDRDVDGDLLTVTVVTPGTNGATTTNGSTVIYTPDAGFVGTDTFVYTISDGRGGTDSATVTVSVVSTEGGPIAVNGRVIFDNGDPAEGVMIHASVITASVMNAIQAVQRTRQMDMTRPTITGEKPSLPPTALRAFDTRQSQGTTTVTNANGNFTVEVIAETFPAQVVIAANLSFPDLPTITSARMRQADASTLDLGTLILPSVQGSEVVVQNGTGENADGSVRVAGLPAEVSRLFARSYDPDAIPDAFPGDFQEMGSIPLNSSVFAWIEGLDANNNSIDMLSQIATIRVRVPLSQWTDLEDINSGTDRIELPIYIFNETTNLWEQRPEVGWLEDGQGTLLPEDAQSVILDGTFTGELFATFPTNHLSWFNVDYAFIGPWTLSRLDGNRRNNNCLFQALQLARTIARSAAGRQTYAQFNLPGGDLDIELADGAGPEIKNTDLNGAYGEFRGNEQGDQDDQLYFDNSLWNTCGDGAMPEQERDTTLLMAVTLLHETAHWKWDVIHDGGDWRNPEPGGEAGNMLERDLFGGILGNGGGITRDGMPLDNATRDMFLDTNNWPPPADANRVARVQTVTTQQQQGESPLRLTIALAQQSFDLGEEIEVNATYENISNQPIQILTRGILEGYPLWFEIFRENETIRVPFRGVRAKRIINFTEDFVTLDPAGTLQQAFHLLRDPDNGSQQYNLIASGDYQITAFYSPHWGLPETQSNTLSFTLNVGGSLSGLIASAATGTGISGATVQILQGTNILATATAEANGTYTIPELPPGTYTLEARGNGFLRSTQENVQIVSGQSTVVNVNLSSLLSAGELRVVLTWGTEPRDLDSHLWLPLERPFHVFFSRRGALETCPFANLDVDDTSSFGPETITIQQRLAGTYLYAIHRFSDSSTLALSQAQVQVFDSSGLIATFNVPTEGSGDWWQVFSLDGVSGQITEINALGGDPAPYGDTAMGCATQ